MNGFLESFEFGRYILKFHKVFVDYGGYKSVLLGLPNSGILPSASVFGVLSADSGTSVRRLLGLPLFYDPAFGLEGSLFALCLFCAAAAFLFLKGTRALKE